jgi:hypothetical protein
MYQKILPQGAKVLVDQQNIDQATAQIAKQVNQDYADKDVVFFNHYEWWYDFCLCTGFTLND